MKKKEKVPTLKQIEAMWDSLPSVMEERGPEVIKRNAALRAKDATLNARINSEDLAKFKEVANLNGMKYQSFLGEVIHLVAHGNFKNLAAMMQPIQSSKKTTRKAKAG